MWEQVVFCCRDYMRIAMNSFTSATLPFIRKSSWNQTDLMQTFVQDPETGLPPVPGLQIETLRPFGSDSTFPGGLSVPEIQQRMPDTHASVYYLQGR